MRSDIGKVLKDYFEQEGISQTNAAKSIGVSQPYMARIISGAINIGYHTAQKLVDVYGFSLSFLLSGNGPIFDNGESKIMQDVQDDIDEVEDPDIQKRLMKAELKAEGLQQQVNDLQSKLQEAYKQIAKLEITLETSGVKKEAM